RALFIVGERSMDRLGSWVNAADLDDDGHVDVIMGMDQSEGPANDRTNVGAAVIWWGQETIPTSRVRVGDPTNAEMLTTVYGRDEGDLFGATLWVDDWDGDETLD